MSGLWNVWVDCRLTNMTSLLCKKNGVLSRRQKMANKPKENLVIGRRRGGAENEVFGKVAGRRRALGDGDKGNSFQNWTKKLRRGGGVR